MRKKIARGYHAKRLFSNGKKYGNIQTSAGSYHTNKCGIRILFAGNSKELHRHLVLRDFLRNNPEAVKKYSAVKEKAAKLFPDDIGKYIAYKSPCIEELYQLCGLIKS